MTKFTITFDSDVPSGSVRKTDLSQTVQFIEALGAWLIHSSGVSPMTISNLHLSAHPEAPVIDYIVSYTNAEKETSNEN